MNPVGRLPKPNVPYGYYPLCLTISKPKLTNITEMFGVRDRIVSVIESFAAAVTPRRRFRRMIFGDVN